MQFEEEHLWTQTVLDVLQHNTWLPIQTNGIHTKSDPCIYKLGGNNPFYVGVPIDDMYLAGKDETRMNEVKQQLHVI